MFDGILKNMAMDAARAGLVALATYFMHVGVISCTGTDTSQCSSMNNFIGAGMYFAAIIWAWWENVGHQKIVEMLKSKAGNAAPAAALNMTLAQTKMCLPWAIFIAVALSFYATDARAQVVVTKVPPAAVVAAGNNMICPSTLCSGLYAGTAIANGIIVGDIGVQYWNGSAFLGTEIGGGAQVYTDPALTTNTNGFFGYQIAKFGGTLTALIPSTSPPTNYPQLLIQNVVPYALAGAVERDVHSDGTQSGWAVGGGAEYGLTQKLFVDVKYMYVNYGGDKLPSESVVMAGANYKF
jgi:hypothetical protein